MSVELDPQLEAARAYVTQTIRDATAWAAERLYQDPNHEIKKRRRQSGGHIPSGRSSPRPSRSNQGDTRSLTPEDVSDFEAAAESRPTKSSPQTIEGFLEEMWLYDHWRMRRLRKDMNWLRKQAQKNNIAPWNIPWRDI